ncbi:MAG: DJ-1/PfpI family protein [Bacteroidota bacterium]
MSAKNLCILFASFSICLSTGCSSDKTMYPPLTEPTREWNVAFLIMNGVYNTELTAPMDVFQHTIFHTDPGMRVFTIAKNLERVRSFEGLVIQPDYSYVDTFPPIDILVVPSAEHHLDSDLEDEEMLAFVREIGMQAKYVMSLCDGAFVLAKAGLLDNAASTTFPSDIPAYKQMFPQLTVYEEVIFVHDGKYITGAGGARSFEPALYLCERLYGKKVAEGIGRGLVIEWDLEKLHYDNSVKRTSNQ